MDKLDKEGLWKVWQKVLQTIKLIAGDVDYKNKGTLQQQIDSKRLLNSTTATEAGKFAADAVQLNKAVPGSYAAGVSEEISGINAGLASTSETGIFFGNVSHYNSITVWAHGCIVKNAVTNKLDLHIQAQILNDATNNNEDTSCLIDLEKLKPLIKVNSISFGAFQTIVSITNQQGGNIVNIGDMAGYTGLLLHSNGGLARMYTEVGHVGTWGMNLVPSVLQKGMIYHIDVYGASYS